MIDFLAFILISTGYSLASDVLEVYKKKWKVPHSAWASPYRALYWLNSNETETGVKTESQINSASS